MKQVLDIPRTAMEVFNMLPEGTRCEVIDNTIYMSPSPIEEHQDILGDIYTDLKLHTRQHGSGKVYMAPFDVYLNDKTDVVQPDLLFIKPENFYKIKSEGITGAPDLVLEVLSSNFSYDTNVKFKLYQNSGVNQYIVINPVTKEGWHYQLVNGNYQLLPQLGPGILELKFINLIIQF